MSKMAELKRKILRIVFWIALIVGIVMVLWRIFGNSPTDLAVISPFIAMAIIKLLSVSDDLKNFRYQAKLSFNKVKENIGRIENKIDLLKK